MWLKLHLIFYILRMLLHRKHLVFGLGALNFMEHGFLRNSVQNYYHVVFIHHLLLDPLHFIRSSAWALGPPRWGKERAQCFEKRSCAEAAQRGLDAAVLSHHHAFLCSLYLNRLTSSFFSLKILFSRPSSKTLNLLLLWLKVKESKTSEQKKTKKKRKRKKARGTKWAWNICLCHTIRDYSMNDGNVLKIHLTSQLDGSPSGQILTVGK